VTRLRGAVGTTFRSLRVRNFRLFFVGQLISQIGTWLTTIALTLLVLHRTGSGVAIGALVACQFGPVLLLGAYGGVVADRMDKRRLLLVTQTLEMLQSFTLAALAFMPHVPLLGFYLTALAGGFMLAFDNPVRRSFVPEMVPEEEVQNAATLNSAIMTSARVFGPALGGLLVVTAGYPWAFTLDGTSYLAVIAAIWMMRSSELHRPPPTPRAKGQVRDGLRYVRGVPELWVPLVMVTIVGTLTFNFSVVLPLFVERTLHGNDTTYTLLYSVLSVGSFLGAVMTAHRASIDVSHIARASLAFGVAMVALAAAPGLGIAFPLALVVGATSIAFMASATAIVQVRADPARRGRVLALQAMVMIGSTPIGGPVLGAVCDRFGARTGLVIGGIAAVAAAGYGWRVHRRRPPVGDGTAATSRGGRLPVSADDVDAEAELPGIARVVPRVGQIAVEGASQRVASDVFEDRVHDDGVVAGRPGAIGDERP
jgi:MFS family permease